MSDQHRAGMCIQQEDIICQGIKCPRYKNRFQEQKEETAVIQGFIKEFEEKFGVRIVHIHGSGDKNDFVNIIRNAVKEHENVRDEEVHVLSRLGSIDDGINTIQKQLNGMDHCIDSILKLLEQNADILLKLMKLMAQIHGPKSKLVEAEISSTDNSELITSINELTAGMYKLVEGLNKKLVQENRLNDEHNVQ